MTDTNPNSIIKLIESKLLKKNITEALSLIGEFREKFPFNKKIDYFLEKQKKHLYKKHLNSKKQLLNIYKSTSKFNAIEKLVNISKNDNSNSLVYSLISNLYGELGELNLSKSYGVKAISLNPFEENYYFNLSMTLDKLTNYNQSFELINIAKYLNPFDFNINLQFARCCFNLKKYNLSIATFEKILNVKQDLKVQIEYLRILLTSNKFNKVLSITNDINFSDEDIDLSKIRATALMYLNRIDEAKELLLNVKEKDANLYSHLGLCEDFRNNFLKARKYHERASEIDSNSEFISKNLANNYYYSGDFEFAIKLYNSILEKNKSNFEVRYFLSLLQLNQNNFEEGWKNFSFRWHSHVNNSKFLNINLPIYQKAKNYKSVLVWSEAGIGDQILFSRTLRNLQKENIKIYVYLDNKLNELLKLSFPKIIFLKELNLDKIESHISQGDLCKLYITSKRELVDTSRPYLISNKKITNRLKHKFPRNKIICGISWLSQNVTFGENKSINLEKLKNILLLPNIVFVDLQYGDTKKEKENFLSKFGVEILTFKEIDNYNDILSLSNLISCCDYVLTISNTTAHLSGGLGVKTMLMLPKGKGRLWYWSSDKKQSLWYKSIDIYEQSISNSWDGVIQEILLELKKYE